MQNPKLLINRWMTKDGTILISRTQNDFQSHFDQVDQRTVYIDGGLGPYVRISGDLLNQCLYDTDEDHPEVRGLYLWTSYGINGDEPAQKRPIKDLTTEHIQAIIRTQIHLPKQVLNMFKRELAYRNLNS